MQAAPPMSSHKDARNAELELGVISLRRALKQAQAQAAASAKPKPPVDPNTEVARLKKTIQTLRGKIADLMRWHDEQMRKSGKMPLPTFRAVIKCLLPTARRALRNASSPADCLMTLSKIIGARERDRNRN